MQITPSSNLIAALSALQQPQRVQSVNSTVGLPPVAPTAPTAPVVRPQPILPQQQLQPADPSPARPQSSPLGRYIDIRV